MRIVVLFSIAKIKKPKQFRFRSFRQPKLKNHSSSVFVVFYSQNTRTIVVPFSQFSIAKISEPYRHPVFVIIFFPIKICHIILKGKFFHSKAVIYFCSDFSLLYSQQMYERSKEKVSHIFCDSYIHVHMNKREFSRTNIILEHLLGDVICDI